MLIYNIDFIIAGLIFILVILRHFLLRPTLHLVNNKSFLWLILTSIIYIISGISSTVLVSKHDPSLRDTTEFFCMCFYMLQVLVPHAFMWHIQDITERDDRNSMLTVATRYVLPFFMCAMVVMNHWSHIFFTVSRSGAYSRGPFYKGMYVFAGTYLLLSIYYTFSKTSHMTKARRQAIIEIVIYSVIAVTVQYFNPDVLLSSFGVALGITVLFFTINNPFNHTEPVTSAFDVRYLEEVYRSVHQRSTNMYIVAVTLTQLKRLNLIMGTKKGNTLLRNISMTFKNSNRSISVFRSGRRFIIACPTLTSLYKTAELATDTFSSDILLDGEHVKVPATICVIDNLKNIDSSDTLLSYIEFMTNTGSNSETNVIASTDKLFERFTYSQEIESYLDEAIEKDLFTINYQPIWDTKRNRYTTLECLSRLRHPKHGNVPPNLFIEIAEKNDQINRIGFLQIHRMCRFLKSHPELMNEVDSFKFNLSPAELMREGHVEELISIIESYDLPLSFFQFEITETVATEYGEALDGIISMMTQKGMGLSLDDFGSGYANLNSVLKLPFSSVKLDRSMLFGTKDDGKLRTFYSSVVSTFHTMGYTVVAEGVETKAEKDMVTKMGVDLIQGYYYSRPVPENELLKILSGQEEE